MFRAFAVVFLIFTLPCAAADIMGQATVIDGDTIEIHGTRIRLYGIDAPEAAQTCQTAGGKEYRCGQQVALALAEFIGRHTVTCLPRGKSYERIVAVCVANGEDLSSWLVSNGLALAYRKYSLDYADYELKAAKLGRGIWSGEFVAPWD